MADDLVAVRDDKDPTGPVHTHSRLAWVGFTTRLRELGAVPFATEHVRVDVAAGGVTLHQPAPLVNALCPGLLSLTPAAK